MVEFWDGSKYIQTVRDRKFVCADLSAIVSTLLGVHQTCVHHAYSRIFAFTRFLCIHVQGFVRARSDFVQQIFVCCPVFLLMFRDSCVYVQTFVRSADFLSCDDVQTLKNSKNFGAFTCLWCVGAQTLGNLIFLCICDFSAFIRFPCAR